MSCLRDSLTKSFDLGEDRICSSGPCEWHRVGVPVFGVALNSSDELFDVSEGVSSDGALRDDIEPDFDLVEPRGVGRCEVDVEARVLGQPCLDLLVFMGRVIVHHDVEVQIFGDAVVYVPQELQELLVTVPRLALRQDFPGFNVQSRK